MSMVHEVTQLTPRRQRSRAAKKERILQAALALVVAEGMEGLTIARLANELDYAVGALYRYFPSKDDLLAELNLLGALALQKELKAVQEELTAALAAQPAGEAAAALARVMALSMAYERFWRTQPDQFRLVSLFLSDPKPILSKERAEGNAAQILAMAAEAAQWFMEAARVGALSQGDALMRTVSAWSSIHGCLQIAKMSAYQLTSLDPQRVLDELTMTLLRGWGAREDHLNEARSLLGRLPQTPVSTPMGDPRPQEGQAEGTHGRHHTGRPLSS